MKPYRTPRWSVTGTRSDKILQREPTPSESAIKRAALFIQHFAFNPEL